MSQSKLYSIILLSYQSASRMEEIFEYYKKGLEKENIPFEFIIMDDGSTDNSFEIALQLERKDSRVRAYALSKNYTSPYSQFAGLKVCKGACAMFVSDDYQRPIENVVLSYRKWEEGHKIVIANRLTRNDGTISMFFSRLYYKVMNRLSEVEFPYGGTDGFLADREVIDLMNERISPINTSPIVEVLRLGFQPLVIPFHRPESKYKSRWTFSKKIRLAKDTFLASSSFPIKLITWLGLAIFLFSIILIIGLILGKLFSTDKLFGFPIQGWTSTMILVTFFNGLTLFCMGIVAEYVLRIFDEVKGRPGYIIKKKDSED